MSLVGSTVGSIRIDSRLLSRLGHPGICQVHELVEAEAMDGKDPELVRLLHDMEALDARRRRLRARITPRHSRRGSWCGPLTFWRVMAPWLDAMLRLGREDEAAPVVAALDLMGYRRPQTGRSER